MECINETLPQGPVRSVKADLAVRVDLRHMIGGYYSTRKRILFQ